MIMNSAPSLEEGVRRPSSSDDEEGEIRDDDSSPASVQPEVTLEDIVSEDDDSDNDSVASEDSVVVLPYKKPPVELVTLSDDEENDDASPAELDILNLRKEVLEGLLANKKANPPPPGEDNYDNEVMEMSPLDGEEEQELRSSRASYDGDGSMQDHTTRFAGAAAATITPAVHFWPRGLEAHGSMAANTSLHTVPEVRFNDTSHRPPLASRTQPNSGFPTFTFGLNGERVYMDQDENSLLFRAMRQENPTMQPFPLMGIRFSDTDYRQLPPMFHPTPAVQDTDMRSMNPAYSMAPIGMGFGMSWAPPFLPSPPSLAPLTASMTPPPRPMLPTSTVTRSPHSPVPVNEFSDMQTTFLPSVTPIIPTEPVFGRQIVTSVHHIPDPTVPLVPISPPSSTIALVSISPPSSTIAQSTAGAGNQIITITYSEPIVEPVQPEITETERLKLARGPCPPPPIIRIPITPSPPPRRTVNSKSSAPRRREQETIRARDLNDQRKRRNRRSSEKETDAVSAEHRIQRDGRYDRRRSSERGSSRRGEDSGRRSSPPRRRRSSDALARKENIHQGRKKSRSPLPGRKEPLAVIRRRSPTPPSRRRRSTSPPRHKRDLYESESARDKPAAQRRDSSPSAKASSNPKSSDNVKVIQVVPIPNQSRPTTKIIRSESGAVHQEPAAVTGVRQQQSASEPGNMEQRHREGSAIPEDEEELRARLLIEVSKSRLGKSISPIVTFNDVPTLPPPTLSPKVTFTATKPSSNPVVRFVSNNQPRPQALYHSFNAQTSNYHLIRRTVINSSAFQSTSRCAALKASFPPTKRATKTIEPIIINLRNDTSSDEDTPTRSVTIGPTTSPPKDVPEKPTSKSATVVKSSLPTENQESHPLSIPTSFSDSFSRLVEGAKETALRKVKEDEEAANMLESERSANAAIASNAESNSHILSAAMQSMPQKHQEEYIRLMGIIRKRGSADGVKKTRGPGVKKLRRAAGHEKPRKKSPTPLAAMSSRSPSIENVNQQEVNVNLPAVSASLNDVNVNLQDVADAEKNEVPPFVHWNRIASYSSEQILSCVTHDHDYSVDREEALNAGSRIIEDINLVTPPTSDNLDDNMMAAGEEDENNIVSPIGTKSSVLATPPRSPVEDEVGNMEFERYVDVAPSTPSTNDQSAATAECIYRRDRDLAFLQEAINEANMKEKGEFNEEDPAITIDNTQSFTFSWSEVPYESPFSPLPQPLDTTTTCVGEDISLSCSVSSTDEGFNSSASTPDGIASQNETKISTNLVSTACLPAYPTDLTAGVLLPSTSRSQLDPSPKSTQGISPSLEDVSPSVPLFAAKLTGLEGLFPKEVPTPEQNMRRELLLRERLLKSTLLRKMERTQLQNKLKSAEALLVGKRAESIPKLDALHQKLKKLDEQKTASAELAGKIRYYQIEIARLEKRKIEADNLASALEESVGAGTAEAVEFQTECLKLRDNCIEFGGKLSGINYRLPVTSKEEYDQKLMNVRKSMETLKIATIPEVLIVQEPSPPPPAQVKPQPKVRKSKRIRGITNSYRDTSDSEPENEEPEPQNGKIIFHRFGFLDGLRRERAPCETLSAKSKPLDMGVLKLGQAGNIPIDPHIPICISDLRDRLCTDPGCKLQHIGYRSAGRVNASATGDNDTTSSSEDDENDE